MPALYGNNSKQVFHLSARAPQIEGIEFANRENAIMDKDIYIKLLVAGVAATFLMAVGIRLAAAGAAPTIIDLTQVPCQFVESENGVDLGYQSRKKADCDAINSRSADQRLAGSKILQLKPGKYIFRVTNKSVPYELGFWLRGQGFSRLTLPSVSGGGLTTGVTKDYVIELEAGEYYYSCPLNTTPDYQLMVAG